METTEQRVTPGPWYAAPDAFNEDRLKEDGLYWGSIEGDGWYIAAVHNDVSEGSPEANAHLLAASWEMMRALERYVFYNADAASFHEDFKSPSFLRSCGLDDKGETHEEWLDRVLHVPGLLALARARGEG